MKKCTKCNREIENCSMFCNYCGAQQTAPENKEYQKPQESEECKNETVENIQEREAVKTDNKDKIDLETSIKKNLPKVSSKKIIIGGIAAVAVICIIVMITVFTNPVNALSREIKNENYEKAATICSEDIINDSKMKEKAETSIAEEINKIIEEFKNDKLEYAKAIEKLDSIKSVGLLYSEAAQAAMTINNIQDSKIAYNKAVEYKNAEDYISTISEYSKVIKEDNNYKKAQETIESLKAEYKPALIEKVNTLEGEGNYKEAIDLLNEGLNIFPKDIELSNIKVNLNDLLLKQQEAEQQKLIEGYKNNQLITVTSSSIVQQSSRWKSLYPDMIQVYLKNNSDKTVKNFDLGCVAYDSNGYPIKIKTSFSFDGGMYEFVGNGEDVNILPGGTFGNGVGWNLDENHGISTVLSCVKTANFYDGTTWENPYYPYWLKIYKEVPLESIN